jgi:hypothetical protein
VSGFEFVTTDFAAAQTVVTDFFHYSCIYSAIRYFPIVSIQEEQDGVNVPEPYFLAIMGLAR